MLNGVNRIIINFVPHTEQRYDTVGDYQQIDNILFITISQELGNDIAFETLHHELREWELNKKAGISDETVDKWDFLNKEVTEGCPYFEQHNKATELSRFIAEQNGSTLEEYDEVLDNVMGG